MPIDRRNRLYQTRPIGSVTPPIRPPRPVTGPTPPVGPVGPIGPRQPTTEELRDPTKAFNYLLGSREKGPGFTSTNPLTGESFTQEGGYGDSPLDIFRAVQGIDSDERTRATSERQARLDEERNKIERERMGFDKEENRLRRDTDLAIEEGRFRDALAGRRNEMNISRLKAQLDFRQQNLSLMSTLLENPILFPALQSQGGVAGLLNTLPGMPDTYEPDVYSPGSTTSLRGQPLPFNPNAVPGMNISSSEWDRLTPRQQAFLYDNSGTPIGFTSTPGTYTQGARIPGAGPSTSFDTSAIQETLRRSFPLAQLRQSSGGRAGFSVQGR